MDCGACGERNRKGAVFCDHCGVRLVAGHGATAERLSAPAAERRLVTVLFADAQGSTALTGQIGDEELYRLMQRCTATMATSVEEHGGTVSQFRGDGIMALFGAPVAIERAAVSAVNAGLDMQVALAGIATETRETLGAPCHFRIGVHTGSVVVGRLDDAVQVDYTAIGDTANVAARMEQAAEPGTVCISDATRRSVDDFIDCDEVGELAVKGKVDPIRAWRALSRRRVTTRLDAAAARGLSSHRGRDRELAALEDLVIRARSGDGQMAVISGGAGVGKSRLLLELHRQLPAGVAWLEGRANAHDEATPWHLVTDLLANLFAIGEEDSVAEVGARIHGDLAHRSATARAAAPWIEWVLHLDGHGPASLDPRDRRAGVLDAVRTVVTEVAAETPLVVVAEDLHWADEASRAAVGVLAEVTRVAPVALIITRRPGSDDAIGDDARWRHLALTELDDEDSAALAGSILGAGLPAAVARLVAERAEGNPLFIEELMTSLVQSGVLDTHGKEPALNVPEDHIAVPDTVQEVILARIDRLAPAARQVLALASVIGRRFSPRLLARVGDGPGDVDDRLVELETLDLVRRVPREPEPAYAFKHAVTQEVTYSTLLDERRRRLHRRVGEAVEDLHHDRLDEHAATLARHWLEAGERARALPHLWRAGERALAGYSVAEAVSAYDRAIEIAEELGEDGWVIEVCQGRIEVARLIADMPTCVTVGETMRRAARRLGRLGDEAMGLCARGKAELFMHRFDQAGETLTEAIDIGRRATEESGEMDGLVLAGVWQGLSLAMRGHLDEAAELWQRTRPPGHGARIRPSTLGELRQTEQLAANWRAHWNVPSAAELVDDMELAEGLLARWSDGLAAAGRGDYLDALARLQELVEISERLGETLARARALNTLGWIHLDLGDLTESERLNRASVDLVAPMALPNPGVEHNARLNLADLHRSQGDLAAAEAELATVERVVRAPTPPEHWMLWRYSQHWLATGGETRLDRGDPDGALQLADECLELAGRTSSRKYLVRGRRLRACALAARHRSEEAETTLTEALALARDVANPPEVWRTLAARTRLLADTGRRSAATATAAEALEVIDEVAAGLGSHPLAGCLRTSDAATSLAALAR